MGVHSQVLGKAWILDIQQCHWDRVRYETCKMSGGSRCYALPAGHEHTRWDRPRAEYTSARKALWGSGRHFPGSTGTRHELQDLWVEKTSFSGILQQVDKQMIPIVRMLLMGCNQKCEMQQRGWEVQALKYVKNCINLFLKAFCARTLGALSAA